MRFGLLLPHFGAHATPERVLGVAARAEELGFRSLWVRDHLLWTPHGYEGHDPTFIDPFVTLAAAATVTKRVSLGTAVVIPTRWPLKLAQEYASLSWLSRGRVVAGIGLGYLAQEFQANGFDFELREQIFVETTEICRLVWSQSKASYKGELFSFEGISLDPKPARPIPVEYGGTAPAALRRAIRYTDGWQASSLPLATLDKRLAVKRRFEEEQGRRISTSVQPLMTIARRREDAVARVPVAELGAMSPATKLWDRPPSGQFETVEELEGVVTCGTPEQVGEQVQQFERRGVDEFIVDLRLQFDLLEESVQLFGAEVLPRFAS